MTVRSRVHQVLEGHDNLTGTLVRWFLALLILTNIAAVVLETLPEVHRDWATTLYVFEAISLAIFMAEYILRIWSAGEHAHYQGLRGRLRWAVLPSSIIDLLAVAPTMLISDMRIVRVLRLARLIRIAKIGRYSLALRTLRHVVLSRMPDLFGLSFVLLVMLLLSSALMYHLEHSAQPEVFSSIPASMWWGIVTLTTIGYGDMAPITMEGRMLGSLVAILGIGMFALPAGLLGGAFMEELGRARRRARAHRVSGISSAMLECPHCHQPLTHD